MVLGVSRVMRELGAVIVGQSAATGRGTGNRVCVGTRWPVNDTGNGVWGSGTRDGLRGPDSSPVFKDFRRCAGGGTGNRVCRLLCGVRMVLRRISSWTRNAGCCV